MPPPPGNPPPPIRIRIDAGGSVSWNGSPVAMSILQSQFDVEGARGDTPTGTIDATKQPTIEIETDRDAEYEDAGQGAVARQEREPGQDQLRRARRRALSAPAQATAERRLRAAFFLR